jgi:flagellar motor switch protein FliN/FliY
MTPEKMQEETHEPDEDPIAPDTEQEPTPGGEESRESVSPVEFEEARAESGEDSFALDLLLDVSLPVRVELGRTTLSVEQLLDFGPGSVVELDKMAGEPAELYIRDTFFARGEVVVVDNNFGLRITDLSERVQEIAE